MSTEESKNLRFIDILLLSFASFMSIELISSLATMGPSVIFSMLFLGLAYAIPHVFLCAELGSTYPDQGGIYAWVKLAFGSRAAARSTWFYWVNVLGFVPSALIVTGAVFQELFMPNMSVWAMVWFCIISTWILVLTNCFSLSISKWVTSVSSVAKGGLVLTLIFGAIYTLVTKGSATSFTLDSIIPTIDLQFFALVPVFVYSLTGMDIVSCVAGEMENPKKDVPKSAFTSLVLSIAGYLLAACAMIIILPSDNISESSGLIDAFAVLFGGNRLVMIIFGIFMIIGLFGYTMGWVIGGTYAAKEAGESGELSKVFAISNKAGAPVGASILTGIGSSVLLLSYGFIAKSNEGLFWSMLAFTSILFFIPYMFMSFAYIKLKRDKVIERPFKIPGSDGVGNFIAIFNFILLLISLIFYFIPPAGENPVSYIIMLAVGIGIFSLVGEVIVRKNK